MITPSIFRAYDIRGVYEKDFNLEGSEDIGKGYGTYLLRTSSNHERPLRVCVGRDARTHGPEVHEAFMRGLASTGIQVVDVGLCFSPLLFFAICAGKFDGGVNITASHNPAEYNGFKLQREDAHAICGDEIQTIYELIEEQDFIRSDEVYDIEEDRFWKEYIDKVVSLVSHPQKAHVVIDAGNGVTGKYAPELFRLLGYTVTELFCELDGTFPNHQADPENEENMKDLQKKVQELSADFGIAFDGDGDRVGIVDNEGTIYHADLLLILLARDVLSRHPGTPIIHTVTSSGLVADAIIQAGGRAIECKVGHSFVEEKMRETGALIGGESSGHIFFGENYYGVDDGVLAAVKILDAVLNSGKPLKDHFKDLPKVFTSPEYKKEVSEEKKFAIVAAIQKRLLSKYEGHDIDGAKVQFGNGAWGIARASNTSPKISFRCEARDQQKLDEIVEIMNNVIEEEIQNIS